MSGESLSEWGGDDFPEPGEMGFDDFGMDGVDTNDIGSGRIKLNVHGWYHFRISAQAKPSPYGVDFKTGETDHSKSRKPSILLTCEVQHSAPNQSPRGSIHFHDLILGGDGPGATITKSDKEQTLNFLVGVGILKIRDGQVIDPETGSVTLKTSTLAKRLNGLQFIGHIDFKKGNEKEDKPGEFWPDKLGFLFGRGAFTVDDPRVAHVPKDMTALRAIGKESAGTASPTPGKAPANPTPAKAPAKPADDDLPDDL